MKNRLITEETQISEVGGVGLRKIRQDIGTKNKRMGKPMQERQQIHCGTTGIPTREAKTYWSNSNKANSDKSISCIMTL